MPMQDWDHTARCEDVLAPFTTFDFPFLNVPELIRGAATIYQYPMVDRDPLPSWDFGRSPFLATLPTQCIRLEGMAPHKPFSTLVSSPENWQRGRRSRTLYPNTMHSVAQRPPPSCSPDREGGPERSMALVEERAPDGFVNLEDVVSQEELERIAKSYKQIAGFDPETLNSRPRCRSGSRPTRGSVYVPARPEHCWAAAR